MSGATKMRGNADMALSASLLARNGITLGARARSVYRALCFKPNGELRWAVEVPNIVFDVGKNSLLNVSFNAASQVAIWYVGLVDSTSFTAYAAGDTISSHAGWLENVNYIGTDRGTWTSSGAAAAGSINNSPGATFIVTTTVTIRGAFLIGDGQTKGGTVGTLYGAADFGAPRSMFSGDGLKILVTLTV